MSAQLPQQQLESPSESPSQDAPNDTKKTTYSDPSGPIFSMYITRALKFDDENVENWKGSADSILVFTGLFSSTVATFISMSYPNLQQDPNFTTQSILAQISQQLSNLTNNGIGPAASPSKQSPTAPVVFINSVWFLSLVLSLTCALIATLLQQWARRYLQMVQRNHAPHVRAHIREYFSRGARRFRIIGLVEALPFLILISVVLFFAGLVVFAFLVNHIVAYITLGIVGFCFLSYITLTLMPLIFHDCPYYTPFTSLLWYSAQIIPFFFFSVLYRGSKQMHDRWGTVSEKMVASFHDWRDIKAKSFSEGMISKLEKSAERISMDIYKKTLVRTLHWLNEDHELEEFVTGIPGLCESEALRLATRENGDPQRTVRDVLAALPGPTGFRASLPWSIIRLAQRPPINKPQSVRQQRTWACLKALYYIPGAIHDLLAPYAAGEHYCLELLPLLNSPESLKILDKLWDTPNDDVALSVRCAAAVIAAFMITPPRRALDHFVINTIPFIWEHDAGKNFLSKRLGISAGADGGAIDPKSDSARLQNLVRFLKDITKTLRHMHARQWTSKDADMIRRVRQELFEMRHTEEYRIGRGTFDQRGDRESPTFVPAVQQDLITVTLEILARPVTKSGAKQGPKIVADPVAKAGEPQRAAFCKTWQKLVKSAFTEALKLAEEQAIVQARTQARVPPESVLRTLARIRVQAADSFEMAEGALQPVLKSPELRVEMTRLHYDTSGVV
ncbi:hypothetical protein EDB87DRAFT_1688618 [Lactarius vividus]|nr:hypothetical protein EDB87DRAFT_1688618 [Lactarius vividus]